MLLVMPTLEVAPTAAEITTASILADAARLPVRLILLGVGVKGGMQWACVSGAILLYTVTLTFRERPGD
jgi:hypothetical protein